MNVRQGVTGGGIVALFSSVMIGVNAESFWVPFLTALAFSMLCVGGIVGLVVLANRRSASR